MINLSKMWSLLVIFVFINASLGEFDGLNKFKRKEISREKYVHPNMLARMTYTSESCVGMGYVESGQFSNKATNSVIVPLLVRRFVNILLSKALLKDTDGETVLLESVSNIKSSKLSMSLNFMVNATDLKTLMKFGWKKQNLTIHQIDELLNNVFSAPPPPDHLVYNGCKISSWMVAWSSTMDNVDGILVLNAGIVLCLFWIMVRIIQGKSCWKMLVFGLIVSSVIWEGARMLEEETIKSQSERLRLGEIPEHCLGIDKRSWWEKLVGVNPDDKECFEHNFHKNSKPALRVNYFKAALSLLQSVLELLVRTFKLLCTPDKGQWFFSNWVFQAIMIPSLLIFFALIFTIYFGGSVRFPIFSFGGVPTHPALGSQVQNLPTVNAEVPQIKAPPRQKNRRKKKEVDLPDSSSSSSMVVFNVTSGNFLFRDSASMEAVTNKEISEHLETQCLCKHSLSPTEKDNVIKEEMESSSEENDSVSTNEEIKDNMEDGSAKVKACKNDLLAGGDTNVTEKSIRK